MARQADFGGTRFQGYAQSSNSTVKGKSRSKALEGRKNQIIQEADTKRRQQFREQQAATSFLKGQQTAAEANQKTGQLADRQALDLSQNAQKASLKLESDFQDRSLRFEEMRLKADQLDRTIDLSNQKAKLTYDGVIAQADAREASANTKLFADTIGSLLQFSGSVVQYSADKYKRQEKDKNDQTLVTNTFSLSDGSGQFDAAIEQDNKFLREEPDQLYATEKAIVASTNDLNQRERLREELYTNSYGQLSRSNAVVAANDFPTFFQAFVNDQRRTYRRVDGSPFTLSTMRPGGVDTAIIERQAKSDFFRLAGLGEIATGDVAETIVPVVNRISQSWAFTTNQTLREASAAEKVLAAGQDINVMLDSNKSVEQVFRSGRSALMSSGGYLGKDGLAAKDTVVDILDWATIKRDKTVIDELEKLTGKNGKKFSVLYANEIAKARQDISSGIITHRRNQVLLDESRVTEITRNRISLIAADDVTQDDINRINADTIDLLTEINSPESLKQAAHIQANPQYSQFNYFDLKARQAAGELLDNSFLEEQANSTRITWEEAAKLGYDKDAGTNGDSFDTKAAKRVKEFETSIRGQGTALVMEAIESTPGKPAKYDIKEVMASTGNMVVEDISEDISTQLMRFIRDSETPPSNSDIREEIKRIVKDYNNPLEYISETNMFKYNFGGKDILEAQFTTRDKQGQLVLELYDYSATELASREDIDIDRAHILTAKETQRLLLMLSEGKEIPIQYKEKADAVGTSVTALVEAQRINYGIPEIEELSDLSTSYNFQDGDTRQVIGEVSVDAFRNALFGQESSFDPTAINKDTRAAGLGQILQKNIGPWSREVLGYTVSQREYMRSPELQVKIVNGKLAQYFRRQAQLGYTGETLVRRVAAIWYGGPGAVEQWNNPGYHDNYPGEPNMQEYTQSIAEKYRN
jgi:hypothetical protein